MIATARRPLPPRVILVGRIAWRRLAAGTGLSAGRLLGVLVATTVAVALLGLRLVPAPSAGTGADVYLFAICLVMFFSAWAFGIFGAHAAEAIFQGLVFFRVRPVGRLAFRMGSRLPVAAIGVLLLAATAPASVLMIERYAGYGGAHATASVVLLSASGLSLGRLSHVAAGWVNHVVHAASLRLSIAFMIWLGCAVGGIALLVWSLRHGGDGMAPIIRIGGLVWPLALWLMLTADADAYAAMTAATLLLIACAAWSRPVLDSPARGARIRRPFDPGRPPILARLFAVRQWRNPRCREWIVVSAFFGVLYCAAVVYLDAKTRIKPELWSVRMLLVQIGVAFGVLVRGLSSRQRPVEAGWLIGPAATVWAAYSAVLYVGALTTTPLLLGMWIERAPPSAVAVHVGGILLHAALAVSVSFVLVPRTGSGGGELLASVVYFFAGALAIAALDRVGGLWPVFGMGVVMAAVALFGAMVTETRRRTPLTAHPEPLT